MGASGSDTLLIHPNDPATAVALLTRLPVKARFERSARAAWAYPLAGALLAGLAALPTYGLLLLGIPPMIAAVVFVAAMVIMSGAMHEDGLADTADGLWGGWDKARRLEIMKDSRIGAYGVIALCLSLTLRWLAVAVVLDTSGAFWLLIAVAMLSRAAMPLVMTALPHARTDGLSHAQGRVPRRTALAGLTIATAIAFLLINWLSLPLAALSFLCAALCAATANMKIGGQTGDILGATQQVSEIILLIALLPLVG
ncbi:cobalamin-5'-phosphate synthase [Shimia isoporae]|uniref:Adenosylcobinamide-GDP ribazoletransferase n=1 Tax=Shimia isoporae TaxID=647720 RepID=A0A4R1NXS0_9RHOB|nr:adenosylcobinamide-GDP ribazoletransferase [Shimia isoporae]TCL10058.1 cobalamin-5'-phosphate synthase [Shimia isoporae]